MKFDYYALLSQSCRESYWMFVKTFWHTVSKEKMVANWHMPYLANEIQDNLERVFKGEKRKYDLVCNICPGTSKSTLFSIFLLPWAWTRMPSLRFIGASFTEDLALDLGNKGRQVVQSPLYQQLFPEVRIRKDANASHKWSNTLGGDRYAVGVGGDIIGKHAHVIIIDDPLNPKGARSAADMAKANTWLQETIPSRMVNKEVTWTGLVMQRLSIEDPTALFLKRPDVRHICLPAELSEICPVQPPELEEFYVDGLFDPVRLTRDSMKKMETSLGQFGYAGQFMQSPIPVGGGMFKPNQIEQREIAADSSQFVRIVRAWDKAASANAGDWTVGVKMGLHKDGSYWILDIVRGQWSTDKREETIEATAKKDGRNVRIFIEQEPGSSGKDSAKATIKRLAGYLVTAEPATGKKELRADTFSVQVNAGNVKIVKGIYEEAYRDEMTYFPNGKHDDQIDASSLAFSALTMTKPKLGVFK